MRVLAALDDSELADEVVEALAPWLSAAGAEARLMMVWDSKQVHPEAPSHPPDLVVSDPVVTSDSWARAPVDYVQNRTERRGQMIQRIRNERIASLRSLGERHLKGGFDVEVDGAEDVPEAILRAADDYGADMIAIGTHGRRGLRRVIGGSVAEEVIRNARIPVFVVHQGSVVHPGAHFLVVAHDTARSVELREHLDARTGLRQPRRTDKHRTQRSAVEPGDVEVGLEGVDLTPVGVALGEHVHQPERGAVEVRALRKQDRPGAGAPHRHARGDAVTKRLVHPEREQ